MNFAGQDCCLLSTPVGWVAVMASGERVVEVLIGSSREALSSIIGSKYRTVSQDDTGVASNACLQLDEYFKGVRRHFDLEVDLRGRTPFAKLILQHLARVPFGETLTYGELAERAGYPGCARAVGKVMATNRIPLILPCHRIVGRDRRLTGYSGGDGIKTKRLLLDFEYNELMKII